MWDWINCHILGRHEETVCCEAGTVFLRCLHCSRRSTGWELQVMPPPGPITRRPATPPVVRIDRRPAAVHAMSGMARVPRPPIKAAAGRAS
jgi:hypothetical protein